MRAMNKHWLLGLALIGINAFPLYGVDYVWQTNGPVPPTPPPPVDWADGANWLPAGFPNDILDQAFFNNPAVTNPVNITSTQQITVLGINFANSGTYNINLGFPLLMGTAGQGNIVVHDATHLTFASPITSAVDGFGIIFPSDGSANVVVSGDITAPTVNSSLLGSSNMNMFSNVNAAVTISGNLNLYPPVNPPSVYSVNLFTNSTNPIIISGNIISHGACSLFLTGGNVSPLTLSGDNSQYSGSINLDTNVILRLESANALNNNSIVLTCAGSNTLQLASTLSTGATINYTHSGPFQGLNVDIDPSTTTSLTGVLNLASDSFLNKRLGGTLNIRSNNLATSLGTIDVQAGTLLLAESGALAGPVNLSGAATHLEVDGSATAARIGAFQGAQTDSQVILNAPLRVDMSSAGVYAGQFLGAEGQGELDLYGPQSLTINGDSSSTMIGLVDIRTAGHLVLAGSGALGGAVNLANSDSILTIDATATAAAVGPLSGISGSQILLSAPLTVNAFFTPALACFSTISGGNELTKTGLGTIAFAGPVTISNLHVNGGNALFSSSLNASGDIDVAANSILSVGVGGSVTASNVTSLGSVTFSGVANLDNLNVNAGSAVIDNTLVATSNITVAADSTLTVGTSGSMTALDMTSSGSLGFFGVANLDNLNVNAGSAFIDNTLNVTSGITVAAESPLILGSSGSITTSVITSSGILGFEGPVTLNDFNVNAGSATINSAFNATSSFTVAAGARLGGNGFITTPVVNVTGTLAPGNSIGTTTVNGNVAFLNGSTFEVEFEGNQSDLLLVSQNVTIDPGSTLELILLGNPLRNHVYTAIQAGGTITGAFSTINFPPELDIQFITSDPQLLQFFIPRVLYFDLINTGNPGRVAFYLDSQPDPTGDLLTVMTALDSLVEDPAALRDALNQLHPAAFSAFSLSQENLAIRSRSLYSERANELFYTSCGCAAPHCYCHGVWLDLLGDYRCEDEQGDQYGYKERGSYAYVGADCFTTSRINTGVAFGYARSSLDWTQAGWQGNMDSYSAAIYASDCFCGTLVDASLQLTYSRIDETRHIEFADISRNAKNDHGSWLWAAHLGLSQYYDCSCFSFVPFAYLDCVDVHEDHFSEHGADSIDLIVGNHRANLVRGELGLRLLDQFCCGCLRAIPSVSASVVQEWRYAGTIFNSQMEGAIGTFEVDGLNPDRTLFSPGAELLLLTCNDALSLTLRYEGEFGRRMTDNTGLVKVSYNF